MTDDVQSLKAISSPELDTEYLNDQSDLRVINFHTRVLGTTSPVFSREIKTACIMRAFVGCIENVVERSKWFATRHDV